MSYLIKLNLLAGPNMSIDLPEAKADTLQEVFSDKFQYINLDHYNIYHFEELPIDGRRYQYRLSSKGDLMTVVTHIAGRAVLLVSVWTNMDYEKRLREIHQHILEMERTSSIPTDFRGMLSRGNEQMVSLTKYSICTLDVHVFMPDMRRLHSHGKSSLRRCLSYWTDEHKKAVAVTGT
ncbi:unnamed protein product [Trichobilharzia szidati]|nr:unnamed protein product [Trichobilharzia szidati]